MSLLRAAGLYLVAAVVLTWPLASSLTTHLGAVESAGDPYLNLWILGWGMKAWLSDPLSVLNGRVFDAAIFHPAAGTLTFADHLLLQSLVLAPLYAVSGSLTLCYNVLLIASLALSGLAMHVLARGLTGSDRAAAIAGLAWACWPYRTAHLLHLQLQSLYFLPLAWLGLHRLAAARQWRDALWLGLLAGLQAVSSVYYGVMSAIAIAAGAVSLGWTTGQWRGTRYWTRLAVAAVVGAFVVAPVAWPYWVTQQREGFGRNLFEASQNAAALQSYTQVPHQNFLYGSHGLLLPRPPVDGARDRRNNEHQMFPGLVLIGLAAFGATKGWRTDARPAVATAAVLVVVGAVLSLGPDGARSIYAWTADVVFGFQAIRAPARFAVVAVMGSCVLAAIGIAKARLSVPLVAMLGALMMSEYVNAPLALAPAPATSTPAGRWLHEQPGRGAVLYLPLTHDKENSVFMVRALEHGRPIVNGYSGQRPAYFTSVVDAMADPASIDARATLRELEVQFVVAPEPIRGADAPDSPYVERETFGDDTIYELVWTETNEAALDDVEALAPPAPGHAPFGAGETATYAVQWLTGPLDLAAGTIVLSVVKPTPDDAGINHAAAWAFEATAETAPWVSRFFDARDRFRTSTTAGLLPLLHQRFLREGRRSVDRVFAYDHENRNVRSADSAPEARESTAMALPLTAHARDALAALWYVRTLPLAAGATFEMPINEGGRNMKATLAVGPLQEMVQAFGGAQAAYRVEPRFTTRVQRRQAVEATIWISADARRVPLQADVTGGFGRVRLKLVDYRP